MSQTPNFRGRRAAILHREGETVERLTRQFGLLGLASHAQWQPLTSMEGIDVVLVDADEGWTGLLPWTGADKPVPLVALLASEAPGRIAWALDQGADALIAKPVMSSAIYPALVMAARRHAEARETAEMVSVLRERIRLRPLVLAAVETLGRERGLDEDEAYRQLRREAMRQRLPLEQCAAALLAAKLGKRA